MTSIIVVGAGVSGLTTALVLQERGFQVRVVAKGFGNSLVSTVAGAQWEMPPAVCGFYEGSSPEAEARERQWATTSYHRFVKLARQTLRTGVFMRPVTFYLDVSLQENPLELLKYSELKEFALGLENNSALLDAPGIRPRQLGFTDAYTYIAPAVDTSCYLGWLQNTFLSNGGAIACREIDDLATLSAEADLVVNCTALGAGELARDPKVLPVRGAWWLVYNDGSDFPKVEGAHCTSLASDTPEGQFLFIVPRGDNKLVLGGIAQPERWSVEPDDVLDGMQTILKECVAFMPDLAKCRFVEDGMRVGLRPFRRDEVRCESDRQQDWLFHNYGHGGSGVTLSWGCATAIADAIETSLGSDQSHNRGSEELTKQLVGV